MRGWAAAGTGTQRAWRRPDWPRCPRSRCPRMLYTVTAGTPSFARGVPRTQRSHKNSGVSSRRVGSPCSSGGRTALREWGQGRGAWPRWALTTLSPRPRRTMLREQYVDRARVAVFGKVSRAAVSGGPVQARGRGGGGGPRPLASAGHLPSVALPRWALAPLSRVLGPSPWGFATAPHLPAGRLSAGRPHIPSQPGSALRPLGLSHGASWSHRGPPELCPPHTGILGEQGRAACRLLSAECFFSRKPQGSLAKTRLAL